MKCLACGHANLDDATQFEKGSELLDNAGETGVTRELARDDAAESALTDLQNKALGPTDCDLAIGRSPLAVYLNRALRDEAASLAP